MGTGVCLPAPVTAFGGCNGNCLRFRAGRERRDDADDFNFVSQVSNRCNQPLASKDTVRSGLAPGREWSEFGSHGLSLYLAGTASDVTVR